jgi:hypothetical protein
MGIIAKSQTDMSIMEVVGRAYADVVHRRTFGNPALLVEEAVKTLDFREVADVETEGVETAHRIMGVGSRDEPAADVLDGAKMTGGDVPSCSDESEIQRVHGDIHLQPVMFDAAGRNPP